MKDGDYNGKSAKSRLNSLADVVKGQEAEIVCLQELGDANDWSHFKVDTFAAKVGSKYGYYQAGSTAVMWDTTLYTMLETGYVDCTVATANGGDGYGRECAWVKLQRNEDGFVFFVVSAHFDLNKPYDSANALVSYFASTDRVIVAGDFNADETRKSLQNLFTSAQYTNTNVDFTNALKNNENLQAEWNHDADGYPADYGLTATFPSNGTILDWCYIKGFTAEAFNVVSSAGNTVSDHYPIYTEVTVG